MLDKFFSDISFILIMTAFPCLLAYLILTLLSLLDNRGERMKLGLTFSLFMLIMSSAIFLPEYITNNEFLIDMIPIAMFGLIITSLALFPTQSNPFALCIYLTLKIFKIESLHIKKVIRGLSLLLLVIIIIEVITRL